MYTQEQVNEIVSNVIKGFSYNLSQTQINKKVNDIIKSVNPFSLSEYNNDIDFITESSKKYLDKGWETIRGNILENIQIAVSGGYKSDLPGADIEFNDREIVVSSKSSPNWANADQRARTKQNAKTIKEQCNKEFAVCTSYGSGIKQFEGYSQYSGISAWNFLTGDSEMMGKVIIGYKQSNVSTLKNQYYSNLMERVILFWKEKFYIGDNFDYIFFINYVSN